MDHPPTIELLGYCAALLLALLLAELVLLRASLSPARARALIAADLGYNCGIYLTVTVVLVHMIWFGKDLVHYLSSAWLYVALGLFVVLSLLSLLPITLYLGWRDRLAAGQSPQLGTGRLMLLRLCLLLEIVTILTLGYMATLIEGGHGQF